MMEEKKKLTLDDAREIYAQRVEDIIDNVETKHMIKSDYDVLRDWLIVDYLNDIRQNIASLEEVGFSNKSAIAGVEDKLDDILRKLDDRLDLSGVEDKLQNISAMIDLK